MANTTKRLVGVIFFVIVTAILYFKSGRQNADEVKRINEFFDSFKAEGGAPLPQAVGKASVAGTYNLELVPMDGKLRSADGGSVAYALMQPPFDSSHGSNIIRMPGTGDLLVTWFSGEEEGGDGVAIVVARLENGASSWSTPKVVSRKSMRSAQNPVLWYDPRAGVLHLYHTSQEAFMGQATSVVLRLSSTDGGDTWSEPSVLFDEPGAFLRNQVISSHDGSEFLLPMYHTPEGFFAHKSQYSSILRSSDGGAYWKPVHSFPPGRCVQPSVVRVGASKHLVSYFRSRAADSIYVSTSLDDGMTWSEPRRTTLPNNNSGIQAVALASGRVAIAFNNLEGDHARWPISLALTAPLVPDAAASGGVANVDFIEYVRDLEPLAPAGVNVDTASLFPGGEFSYPSLLQSPDGDIHVTYTFKRETIKYVRVSEEWIMQGTSVGDFVPPKR